MQYQSNLKWIFRKILWPSQNIWTLTRWGCSFEKWFYPLSSPLLSIEFHPLLCCYYCCFCCGLHKGKLHEKSSSLNRDFIISWQNSVWLAMGARAWSPLRLFRWAWVAQHNVVESCLKSNSNSQFGIATISYMFIFFLQFRKCERGIKKSGSISKYFWTHCTMQEPLKGFL